MADEVITLNGLCAKMSALSVETTACEEDDKTSLAQDDTHQANVYQKPHHQHMRLGKKDIAANPGLDTMPAELLFKIDDFLDKTSALSLRLVSRRNQKVFKYRKIRSRIICTKVASQALRRLLIKDAVKAENTGRVLVQDALEAAKEEKVHPGLMQPCACCEAFHRIDCFSVEQLQRSPAYRMCLGHERALRLCDHWVLNYFQLAELRDGQPLLWPRSEYPGFLSHNAFRCGCFDSLSKYEQKFPPPTFPLQKRPYRLENKSFHVTLEADCVHCNAQGKLDAEDGVLRCFDENKRKICPHMKAASLHDFVPEGTFSQPRKYEQLATIKGIIDGNCRSPYCGGRFSLQWQIGGEFPRAFYKVHLEYSRHIKIFGMNGPEWLANTEVICD